MKNVMKILEKVAESVNPVSSARLAAALVYKNEIISIGTNRHKSHPFQKKYSSNDAAIFLHAETDAIYNALRRYDTNIVAKSKLFIYRAKYVNHEKIVFTQGLAKPCAGCQRAIATFGIQHVCFTLDDEGMDYL